MNPNQLNRSSAVPTYFTDTSSPYLRFILYLNIMHQGTAACALLLITFIVKFQILKLPPTHFKALISQTNTTRVSGILQTLDHGALQQKEMSNWIGPTVKQLWNYAMHLLHNFRCLTQTQQIFAWADPAFISYSLTQHYFYVRSLCLIVLESFIMPGI